MPPSAAEWRRPDGFATLYHARKNNADQKEAPVTWRGRGAEGLLWAAMWRPPAPRLCLRIGPNKRGEHSAGHALVHVRPACHPILELAQAGLAAAPHSGRRSHIGTNNARQTQTTSAKTGSHL